MNSAINFTCAGVWAVPLLDSSITVQSVLDTLTMEPSRVANAMGSVLMSYSNRSFIVDFGTCAGTSSVQATTREEE